MEEEKINKIFKSNNKKLIIVLITTILCLGLIVFASQKLDEEKNVEYEDYSKIIGTEKDVEKIPVKLDIVDYMVFAEKEDTTDKFYFVLDDQYNIFVAKLSKKTIDEIDSKLFSEDSKAITYTIKGYTFLTPSEVTPIAVDSLNEMFKDSENYQEITTLEYMSKMGTHYLDETQTPNSDMYGLLMGIGIFGVILSFILFIVFIIYRLSEKKIINKYGKDELVEELKDVNTIAYEKQNLYLTRNYVIGTNGKIVVVPYSDIAYTYPLYRRNNGILVGIFLVIKNKFGKMYNIGGSLRNAEENIRNSISVISEKNPETLIGFTAENNKQYKELVKENKNTNKLT